MAIQTIKATIQMRQGNEEDFDPDKMTAGEWAVSKDTKKVWMCFRPGLVLRMATYEAFEQDMFEIQTILATCQSIQTAVEAFEQLAGRHASQAETWSVASKSWAVGGTGTREGENTNNSKYWSQQSESHSDMSKSWAIGEGNMRPDEAVNSAKYFAEQAATIVDAAGSGGLIPIGTVIFENLPVSGMKRGWMYNISNDFTSDSRFEDGGSVKYKAGSNVYYTAGGKWDVLAGKQVTAKDIGALPISGGNATGNIGIRKTGENGAFFTAGNTGTGCQIDFGVASNGTTRGIYDEKTNKWVVNITDSNAEFGGTANGIKSIVLTNENIDDLKPNVVTFYYAAGSNSVVNNPFGAGREFGLYAYPVAGSFKAQEAMSGLVKKIRYFNNNAWSAWKTIALTDSMTGATSSTAGKSGLVPAPAAGKQNAYLRGDGTWVAPGTTLAATVPGIPLDQTMGKLLKDDIDEINGDLQQATDGQFILPNGLVIQWGIIYASNGKANIQFPVSYKNPPIIVANGVWADNSNAIVANVKSVSAGGAELSVTVLTGQQIVGAGGNTVHWMAIGY